MEKWISVEDRLPNSGDDWECCMVAIFDVLNDSRYVTIAYYNSIQKIWQPLGGDNPLNALLNFKDMPFSFGSCCVTHWMPLPEPPK